MGIARKFQKQMKIKAWDLYDEAHSALQNNDLEAAALHAEQALQRDPSHPGARFLLLEIYLERQKKSKKAIPHLEYLASDRKNRYHAWASLYNIYAKANDAGKIIALYHKHIAHLNEKDLSNSEKKFIAHLKTTIPSLKLKSKSPSPVEDSSMKRAVQKPDGITAGRKSDTASSSSMKGIKHSPTMTALNEGGDTLGPAPLMPAAAPNQYLISPPLDEDIPVRFSFEENDIIEDISQMRSSSLEAYTLKIRGERITLLEGFDTLLCLEALSGVEKYWYQIETVKKVLKYHRGRVLLCDEVGLGKTIEAGMLLKEYLLRGLVRHALILVPPSLVAQWKDELAVKFGIECRTTDDQEYRESPEKFWKDTQLIIASINTAKSKQNFGYVTERTYDLVIVDEAHHVKNRESQNWKLVNALRKKYVFLLTATPVQNDLLELYNLITLLRPGTLGTPAIFKKEFVSSSDRRRPRNPEKLRELLRQVLVRNIRALVDVALPPRSAVTFSLTGNERERSLYVQVSDLVRKIHNEHPRTSRMLLSTLLMEAGSSSQALLPTLIEQKETGLSIYEKEIDSLISLCSSGIEGAKEQKLIEIIMSSGEKAIVFVRFKETLKHLARLLLQRKISCALFHGSLSAAEKEQQISSFRDTSRVLLSTESGGEGKNLQFCSTLINYDLPWNPMKIEQRIGRIHRIGQTEPVSIYNLCLKESIESHILSVLEEKINMFQLVIGEIGMIIGAIESEKEFDDIVLDLWLASSGKDELREGFDRLGQELIEAKAEYMNAQALDRELLADDYSI